MIKNFNDTLSLVSMLLICFLVVKASLGITFSKHRTDTYKGNWKYLREYKENIEE